MYSLRTVLLIASLLVHPSLARAQDSAVAAPVDTSGNTLKPGDVVRLKIWREPDLSGDFLVDEHGTVVVPKLGRVQVVGLSPDSLKSHLINSYAVYLRNPAIDVVLLRRITILGGVRNPGLYPVDPTMTLAEAYALAGGIAPEGKLDEVELVRGDQRTSYKISGATRIGDTPLRSGDQLYVPTRSWLARNTWAVTAALGTTTTILFALLR
jgi:protein involved in polysaccharide export with SLBB domain